MRNIKFQCIFPVWRSRKVEAIGTGVETLGGFVAVHRRGFWLYESSGGGDAWYKRVHQLSSPLLFHIFHALSLRFGDLAGALSQTVFQTEEAHRVKTFYSINPSPAVLIEKSVFYICVCNLYQSAFIPKTKSTFVMIIRILNF